MTSRQATLHWEGLGRRRFWPNALSYPEISDLLKIWYKYRHEAPFNKCEPPEQVTAVKATLLLWTYTINLPMPCTFMVQYVQYCVEELQVQCCWSFKASVHSDPRKAVPLLCAWLQLLWAGTALSWQSLCVTSQSTSLAVSLYCSVFCGLSCVIYNYCYFNIHRSAHR